MNHGEHGEVQKQNLKNRFLPFAVHAVYAVVK